MTKASACETNYLARQDKLIRHLGIVIEEACPNYARARMPLEKYLLNGMDNAHGGAVFTLADVAFGAAINSGREFAVVSLNSSIEFLRPGEVGPLCAEARAVRIGRNIANYDVQIFDGNNQLIARAMITGFQTNIRLAE